MDKMTNGDIKNVTDNTAIQNSLTNIFKTLPGSRRMLHPFASPTWGMLFEQIDDETAMRFGEMLLQAILRWEDRIIVKNLHVSPMEDQSQYVVTLTYKVITDGESSYVFTDVIRQQ
jgi:phage baseplate assembly protein W